MVYLDVLRVTISLVNFTIRWVVPIKLLNWSIYNFQINQILFLILFLLPIKTKWRFEIFFF